MPNHKGCVLRIVFFVIKFVQVCMIYGIITYDSNSDGFELKYFVILLYYYGMVMFPLLVCKINTALIWEMAFSVPAIVVCFIYAAGVRIYISNTEENEDNLDIEEHEELQNFTNNTEIITPENKDEASGKLLLEIFTFILEILLIILELCTFEKKHGNSNEDADEVPLQANVDDNDLDAGIGDEDQDNFAIDEPVAIVEPVAVVEPTDADEPVGFIEHVSVIEPAAAFEPAAAIELPYIDDDDLPPDEEVGSVSQEAVRETSPKPCQEYRRIPYHTSIEDEDDIEETDV